MKEDDFNIFIESCEELINDRINLSISKVSKSKIYKEKYNNYSSLYEQIIKKCSVNDVENFASSIYDISDLENNYIYLQGFVDGILLRENFRNKY